MNYPPVTRINAGGIDTMPEGFCSGGLRMAALPGRARVPQDAGRRTAARLDASTQPP